MGWTAREWIAAHGSLEKPHRFAWFSQQYLPDDIIKSAAVRAFDEPVEVRTMPFEFGNKIGVMATGAAARFAALFNSDIDDADLITAKFRELRAAKG